MSMALPTLQSLGERPSGVLDYISPSRLNLWLRCPLAFKLRYIEGMRSPSSPSQFIGHMVHKALEGHYRHRQLGLKISLSALARRMVDNWDAAAAEEDVKFKSIDAESACQQQALRLVAAYLNQLSAEEPRPLAVEATIEAPLVDPANGENLGIPLLGIIDLVLPDVNGPVITDFKTVARSGRPLEVMHEVQLSSYSYLFRQVSPKPEGGLQIRHLVKTKTPRIETHQYGARSDGQFARLFAVIRAYLDDLDGGQFVFRPGLGCSMCDFRHSHCREWHG